MSRTVVVGASSGLGRCIGVGLAQRGAQVAMLARRRARIDAAAKWIDEAGLQWAMNESDAYALEEALQLKEAHGGEVIVVSAGPTRVGSTIREALAKGADRGIHIECDDLGQRDALGVAQLLAAAVRPEAPDLVLAGLQSEDLGYGQTGVILAEVLGLPHATIIMQVEKQDGGIRVKRELEEGWFQHVDLPLPALLTIQSGISRLRYATLMGIKKAKTKEVKTVPAAQPSQPPASELQQVHLPQRSKQTQILSGDAREAGRQLVERHQAAARQGGRLVFPRLANVEEEDRFAGLQAVGQLLDGDLRDHDSSLRGAPGPAGYILQFSDASQKRWGPKRFCEASLNPCGRAMPMQRSRHNQPRIQS